MRKLSISNIKTHNITLIITWQNWLLENNLSKTTHVTSALPVGHSPYDLFQESKVSLPRYEGAITAQLNILEALTTTTQKWNFATPYSNFKIMI